MAHYNGTFAQQYYFHLTSSIMDLAASDFGYGGWIYIYDNAGTSAKYMISMYGWGNPNACNVILYQASHASKANKILWVFQDASANNCACLGGTFGATTGSWQHIFMRRDSGTAYLYQNGVQVASASCSAVGVIDRNYAWRFGVSSAISSGTDLAYANWAKWTKTISLSMVTGLANGMHPDYYREGRDYHLPCTRDFVETDNRTTVTNASCTIVDSPGLIVPRRRTIVTIPWNIPLKMADYRRLRTG